MGMVAKEFEKHSLPDGFAEKVVREALEAGKNAHERNDNREASRQADIALQALNGVSEGDEKVKARVTALQLKGDSVRFSVGIAEALTYYEEVASLKRAAGDRREYAEYLGHRLAAEYANVGDEEKAAEARREALHVFEELNDKAGQAGILTWLGGRHFMENRDGEALDHLEKALTLYAAPGTVADVPMHAVCWAAVRLLKEIRDSKVTGKTIGRLAACEYLRAEKHGIEYVGQPGFCHSAPRNEAERALLQTPYPWTGQAGTIIDMTKAVGDSWKADVHSYTPDPLKAVATVRSDSETVTTPAGTFNACRLVELTVRETRSKASKETRAKSAELNKRWCGTKMFWYAPGVGLVKCYLSPLLGEQTTLGLIRYTIPAGDPSTRSHEYFPMPVGAWWDYANPGMDERYVTWNHIEVFATDDEKRFLAHHHSVVDTIEN